MRLAIPVCLLALAAARPAAAVTVSSVRAGIATMDKSTATTATVTLDPPVADLSKALLLFDYRVDSDKPTHGLVRGQLVNASTATFTRGATGSGTDVTISWKVVEFSSGMRVVRGSTIPASGSTSATQVIDSVDPAKSFVLFSLSSGIGNDLNGDDLFKAELESATSLKFSVALATDSKIIEWQVVECADCNVQRGSGTIPANQLKPATYPTIAPVPADKALVLASWTYSGNGTGALAAVGHSFARAMLGSSGSSTSTYDTVKIDRQVGTASATTIDFAYEVVEFKDGTTVGQSATSFLASETTKGDSTKLNGQRGVTLISTGARGMNGYASDDKAGCGLFTTVNDSNTGLSVQRAVTEGVTAAVAWYRILFLPYIDLRLTGTDSPDPVVGKGTVNYDLVVTNTDPKWHARNLVLTFTPPADATGVTVTSESGFSCASLGMGSPYTCTLQSLAPSTNATVQVSLVAPEKDVQLQLPAQVKADEPDPNAADNSLTLTTEVQYSADLGVALAVAPSPVAAGQAASFTATVTNAGPLPALGAVAVVTVPAGFGVVKATGTGWTCETTLSTATCTGENLAKGSSSTITVEATAPAEAGTGTATATVEGKTPDGNQANNQAQASVAVAAVADLALALAASPSNVSAGGAATLTAKVENLGPSAAGDVELSVTLPAAVTYGAAQGTGWSCSWAATLRTVTCLAPSLAVGKAPQVQITVTAPSAGGVYAVGGKVKATTSDPVGANDAASTAVSVDALADLAIASTASPATVYPGQEVAFTLAVSNKGPSEATNLRVVELLPPGSMFLTAGGSGWTCVEEPSANRVACTRASLAAGNAIPIVVRVKAPATAGQITDGANVAGDQSDPAASNNSASSTVSVEAAADLGVTITDAPDPAPCSSQVEYLIKVANAGPSPAASVTLTFSWVGAAVFQSASGAGWSCPNSSSCSLSGALAAGASSEVSLKLKMPADAANISVTATAASATYDPGPTANAATATTAAQAAADLSLTMADSPDPVQASAYVTYTLTVANAGPSTATEVKVVDQIPLGRPVGTVDAPGWQCSLVGGTRLECTRARLNASASATIAIPVKAPADGAQITNTATVTATQLDPNPSDNADSEETSVSGKADLAVSIAESADPVPAGAPFTYTFSAENKGPSDAANVKLAITLPPGLGSPKVTPGGGWVCGGIADGKVTCVVNGRLSPGRSNNVLIAGTAPAATGTMSCTAAVSATEEDPAPGNNSLTVATAVSGSADVRLSLSATPNPTAAGGTTTLTAAVVNEGPGDATAATLTVLLPAGMTYRSASGDWTCAVAGQSVNCSSDWLGAKQSTIVSIVAKVPATPGTLTVSGEIDAAEHDAVPANNTSRFTLTVNPGADLAATLSPGAAKADVGEPLAMTAQVENKGPSPASEVKVTFALPEKVEASAAGDGWTCTGLVCRRPSLAKGEKGQIQLTATASAGGDHEISMRAEAVTPDPDLANNEAKAKPHVGQGQLDNEFTALAVEPAGQAIAGSTLRYVFKVANRGDGKARAARAEIVLPPGAAFLAGSATPTGTPPGPFDLGDIPAGGEATLTLSATVVVEAGAVLEPVATAWATGIEPLTRSVSSTVIARPKLTLALEAQPPAIKPNTTAQITATVTGGAMPEGGRLALFLPVGLTMDPPTARIGEEWVPVEASSAGKTVPLPAVGAQGLEVVFGVKAGPDAAGLLNLEAQVLFQGRPASERASASLAIGEEYDLGGCGCGAAGGAELGAGLALLSAVALLRRRRR